MSNDVSEAVARRSLRNYQTQLPRGDLKTEAQILDYQSTFDFVAPLTGGLWDAQLKPKEIPEAIFTISQIKIDGNYLTNLESTGILPIINGSFSDKILARNIKLFESSKVLGPIYNGSVNHEFDFKVTGGWDVIKALWDYFWTKTMDVDSRAKVDGLGFSKSINLRARIPVRKLNVRW